VKTIKINNTIPKLDKNIACIGYFDGLHLGHKKLIDKTIALSKKNNLKASLISFDPDPLDIINKNKNLHIYSKKYSKKIIEEYGFDYYIIIKFDKQLMSASPKEFINNYLDKLNIDTLVCGFDFSFGYKAKGNYNYLKKHSSFKTIKIDVYKYYNSKVSSSRIKDSISKGNFKLASKLLNRDYKIVLTVLKCLKNKSKTIIEAKSYYNDVLIPKDSIFDGFYIKDNKFYIETKTKLNKGDIFEFIP